MRIFSRPEPSSIVLSGIVILTLRLSKGKDLLLARATAGAIVLILLALPISASAQVLARPGWAGSGVTVETWWRRAVFYRIDVARFQDSTGNGRGDLAGVTQRLDYLQSLGVDALVIDPEGMASGGSTAQPLASGFDDLTRQAASHHLRVLVALPAPVSTRSDAIAQYLARARAWLNQGAAGVYVSTGQLVALNNPSLAVYLVHGLRALTNSFPGERILIADAAGAAPAPLANAITHDAQLVAAPAIALATPEAASLRRQMLGNLGSSPTTSGLLQASRRLPPHLTLPQQIGLERTLAAALLASRTAVLIDFGQELGEQGSTQYEAGAAAPLMQWTPTNLTRAPKPPATESGASQRGPTYGTFHPYIKPLPRNLLPPPALPDVELSNTPPPVDPDSLPGFTRGDIDPALVVAATPNAATANVAVEDANPDSLLNLYRRLIQLHHENASIRNGAEDILDFDADDVLLWLRRAPAGSRTSAMVIVACNLSARPFVLSLDAIAPLHLRRSALRDLLSNLVSVGESSAAAVGETTGSLTLAPYAVFLGEVHP
jgi:hypothetical protein